MQETAADLCRSIYRETRWAYSQWAPQLSHANGFRILYGPPTVDAPMLFIGEQPGGKDESDVVRGEQKGWPATTDYATATWRLASQMRKIWPVETLALCTGLNVNFVRSPSREVWAATAPLDLRSGIEAFCAAQAKRIVRALRPQLVVVLGMHTVDRYAEVDLIERRRGHNRLLVRGTMWGIPAYGVMHPSARISDAHMSDLAADFADRLAAKAAKAAAKPAGTS